jgi:NADH-quinone oxidoreductase subunit A
MTQLFFPFFTVLGLALLIPLSMMVLSALLGPRKKSDVKMEQYECGVPSPTGVSRGKLSVKFFLGRHPISGVRHRSCFSLPLGNRGFRQLGALGFLEMGLFILVLVAGLAYAWKKGALEWE